MRERDGDRTRAGRRSGGGGGGENKGTGGIDQYVDQGAGSGNESAAGADRFAKRAHLNFHLLLEAFLFQAAFASGAEQAGGMRFIHHKPGTEPVLQGDDFPKRGEIAVHGENAFGDNQDAALGGFRLSPAPGENGGEVIQVVVAEDTKRGTAQPGTIDDAGVDQLVEHNVIALAEEGGDRPDRGGIAGREQEGGLGALGLGDEFLQLMVDGQRAADQA